MKVDTIEFKTTKRFRQYAVLVKRKWFLPWEFVCDREGTITLYTQKECEELIADMKNGKI